MQRWIVVAGSYVLIACDTLKEAERIAEELLKGDLQFSQIGVYSLLTIHRKEIGVKKDG